MSQCLVMIISLRMFGDQNFMSNMIQNTEWLLFSSFHFPWLFQMHVFHFVSSKAKINISNFYPLTKYRNKTCYVDISKTFEKRYHFSLTFPWLWQFFYEFPWYFHQNFYPLMYTWLPGMCPPWNRVRKSRVYFAWRYGICGIKII